MGARAVNEHRLLAFRHLQPKKTFFDFISICSRDHIIHTYAITCAADAKDSKDGAAAEATTAAEGAAGGDEADAAAAAEVDWQAQLAEKDKTIAELHERIMVTRCPLTLSAHLAWACLGAVGALAGRCSRMPSFSVACLSAM
jgi:hypothetical protein